MGPLQKHLSIHEGVALVKHAYDLGINFIDTAELYDSYDYLKAVFQVIPRENYVVATKCYAYSKETAKYSLDKALKEIGTDYIDIFLLHEQESEYTLKGHYEAIEYFVDMKKKGKIRAFGISTHYISAVKAALKYPEIEIIHPITNFKGLGIQDGTMEEMVVAIEEFKGLGGGVYGMKPFGGGNLLDNIDACFKYVKNLKVIDSIAIGMQSIDEIDYNVKKMLDRPIDEQLKNRVSGHKKYLEVADWCILCGACVEKCDHNALEIHGSKVQVNRERCVLCGYCSSVCPEFCLKVY